MSIADDRLKLYWTTISSLSDRLLSATAFMRDWAGELPPPDNGSELFKAIMEHALSGDGGGVLKDALRMDPDPVEDRPFPEPAGRLVSVNNPSLVNNRSIGGLKLLTDELSERIREFPETEYHRPVLRLLSSNPHTLIARFGSFTAAWDQLVILKYETSVPDPRSSKFDAWFSAVVGSSERFLRNVIGVTILLTGRDLLVDVLEACYQSTELNMPHPSAEQLIRLPSLDDALADSTLRYMERGPDETTRFVTRFGRALGVSLFSADEREPRPGILYALPDFGGSAASTWHSLLDARKAMVGETTQLLRRTSESGPRQTLYRLSLRKLELIAEYLCAFGFEFAMRILAAVASRAQEQAVRPALVDELRHRHSGELRVLVMRLLSARRYGLAWAIAEAALEVEPPGSPGTMLRLNSYFARQRFGYGRTSRAEIEHLDVTDVPRHQLLKEVLLEHLDRRHIEPILERCLEIGDLSLNELDGWPALDTLRSTSWWPRWRRERQSR